MHMLHDLLTEFSIVGLWTKSWGTSSSRVNEVWFLDIFKQKTIQRWLLPEGLTCCHNASNTETIILDTHHNFSNTHSIISEVWNDVTNTHTLSNIYLNKLKGCKDASGPNHVVKVPLILWLLPSNHSLLPRLMPGQQSQLQLKPNLTVLRKDKHLFDST